LIELKLIEGEMINMIKKVLIALFLAMCVVGFSISNISAKETYNPNKSVYYIELGKTNTYIIRGSNITNIEPQGKASQYVESKIDDAYIYLTGLKTDETGYVSTFLLSSNSSYYFMNVIVYQRH
jgi:hypothetical protein